MSTQIECANRVKCGKTMEIESVDATFPRECPDCGSRWMHAGTNNPLYRIGYYIHTRNADGTGVTVDEDGNIEMKTDNSSAPYLYYRYRRTAMRELRGFSRQHPNADLVVVNAGEMCTAGVVFYEDMQRQPLARR